MMNDDQTKNELVRMYESTLADLEGGFARADDQSLTEEEREEAERETLDCVYGTGSRKVVRLTLAGGGPSAWLDVTVDEGEITEVEWVGTWAGPRIERQVERDNPLWRLAEYHVQGWE